MLPTPALDIIICTYNNAASLARTLDTLANQESAAEYTWGVTVVNNRCTDATDEVVRLFSVNAPCDVRLMHEDEPGLTAARRCGVRATARPWLVFVDDDCLLAPDWLAQTMTFAQAHADCGGFGGQITLAFDGEPPGYVHRFRFAWAGKQHGATAHQRPWLAGLGMTLRREALLASGWASEPLLADRIGDHLVSGGDMEISLRVARMHALWYAPAIRLTHVIPARRTTRAYLRRMLFGLGASRHNVAALTWPRGMLPFVGLQLATAVGLTIRGIIDAALELRGRLERAGMRVTVSPAMGWLAAMLAFWRLPIARRRQLLGAAAAHAAPRP